MSSTVSGTIRALIGQQASRLRPHEHGLNTWATPQRCFGRSYKDSRLMAELYLLSNFQAVAANAVIEGETPNSFAWRSFRRT